MKIAVLLASVTCVSAFMMPLQATRTSTLLARTPFIAGNWKMNPQTKTQAIELATELVGAWSASTPCEVCIFAPMPFIDAALSTVHTKAIHPGMQIGAEFAYYEEKGAYTGAVSAEMIKSLGVTWVLAGHSERRTIFGDNDEEINKQTINLLKKGMNVVLCIGETKVSEPHHITSTTTKTKLD